jgi:tRNA-2-methylthio-N6-dimethylallyladenosine synthase
MGFMDKGVFISTYGCQMNVNDTERMYSLLEMSNYTPVASPEQAELIIINSCSVREKPVHKVSSEVGRYRKLKLKNPKLRIGVGGCVAQQEKENLTNGNPLIDFVFGTDAIDQLPELVKKAESSLEKQVSARFEHNKPYQIETLVRNPGVSAFVNITKGCDNFCTFCVVPYTRGRERSRSMGELIKDINALTLRGVREVTLLGQNVNSYASDCGANFAQLLKTVAQDTDIARIRYTTSHPKDFNDELVKISSDHRQKICDYIHLPAQSGSTAVLERMNRGYSREDYLKKVEMIRAAIPGVNLSTDIIVGFPGETADQFNDTLSMLEQVRYDNIYAFKYSPRPFTKAARWAEQLTDSEKSERLERLFALQKPISAELALECDQKVYEVLVEELHEDGRAFGRTSQNRPVKFPITDGKVGQLTNVKIEKARPLLMEGVQVGQ